VEVVVLLEVYSEKEKDGLIKGVSQYVLKNYFRRFSLL